MNLSNKNNLIIFPESFKKDWRIDLILILRDYKNKFVHINCLGWHLTCKDIKELKSICKRKNVEIIVFESTNLESIISASALGLNAFLAMENDFYQKATKEPKFLKKEALDNICFHKGTLRSGEVLEADDDLLVFGDVNPGASVLAGGNVMIWGRLLGIAHAGKNGDYNARITALQLRPVQLRIANKIARGPEEKPEKGLAEEATIEGEIIVIKPARTN